MGTTNATCEITSGGVINAATIVYIPKGLIHCPLNFKKVTKPVMFINIPLTSGYAKNEVSV